MVEQTEPSRPPVPAARVMGLLTGAWIARAVQVAALVGVPDALADGPLPLAELPPVDVVLLSHDHYDHLHEATIRALAARGDRFVTPLGVGAHLARWGVPEARITECDWWAHVALGGLTLTATPARHFSGRRVVDNDPRCLHSCTAGGTGDVVERRCGKPYERGDVVEQREQPAHRVGVRWADAMIRTCRPYRGGDPAGPAYGTCVDHPSGGADATR